MSKTKVDNRKKAIFAALFLVALTAISISAVAVRSAAVATATLTVTKSDAACEAASVQLYEATKEYWGLYYSRGDLIAVNMTDAAGECTFDDLDDTLYYQAIINFNGMTYQANFEGKAAVDINLGATEEVRGNLYIGLVGATIAIIGLIAFGWIKMTNRAPIKVGAN